MPQTVPVLCLIPYCIWIASLLRPTVLLLKQNLKRAGDTYRAIPCNNPTIAEYVTSIALALKIQGSCNFQLRLDGDTPKLFEINCRFSGTTPFCAQLGFNPIEFYIKHRLGLPYTYTLEEDVIVLRYWSEVVIKQDQILALEKTRVAKPSPADVSSL